MRDIRLRDNVPNLVVRLFRQFNRAHNKALEPLGLSTVQAHVLAALFLEGPMTIGALQQLLAMGSSTLTGALDRMAKSGLVAREPVPGDRRASRIVPAMWPKKKRDRLLDVLADAENDCLRTLDSAERKELIRLLHKVSAGLER